MSKITSLFGLRFTTGHAIWAAALIPACILLFIQLDLLWLGITLAVIIALAAVLTVRGRRVTGWVAAVFAWRRRHRNVPDRPSEPAVGATVMPGDHVAVRWQDDYLVAAIELVPRPFTPTVIVNGEAFTDDVVDTRLVERLVEAHCPDLEADVVSSGYRVGKTAPAESGRALRTGGRSLPGAGESAHLDRVASRPGTHAQVLAAAGVRSRRA